MSLIVGVDPGFANFGYSLAYYDGPTNKLEVFEFGTIQTKPCKDYSAAEDLLARTQDIAETLTWRVRKAIGWDDTPYAMCIEGMSYPRNASSAVKLGASHGMVAAFCAQWLPEVIYCRSPQHIRKTIMGIKKGKTPPEHEVHEWLLQGPYAHMHPQWRAMNKSEQPHAVDALAAMASAYLERAF